MSIAAMWIGIPEPVRKILMWIGAILAVVILGRAYIEAKKNEARKDERRKAEAKTIEVVNDIQDRSAADADAADTARDTAVVYDSADSVRPYIADRIFRD